MKNILLATHNAGKIAEFTALFSPIKCIPQDVYKIKDIEETGASFIENALIKARHASICVQGPALADDSGLVVRALGGQPGIYSARYAGINAKPAQNIEKLLTELQDVPHEERDAYFYCALVLLRYPNDPTPIIATGRCDGWITDAPSGTYGFGYDPIFYVPSTQCTMANISPAIKNTISHRALAMQSLRAQLPELDYI
jgi:XTP/dITP diphosphohydrolase